MCIEKNPEKNETSSDFLLCALRYTFLRGILCIQNNILRMKKAKKKLRKV